MKPNPDEILAENECHCWFSEQAYHIRQQLLPYERVSAQYRLRDGSEPRVTVASKTIEHGGGSWDDTIYLGIGYAVDGKTESSGSILRKPIKMPITVPTKQIKVDNFLEIVSEILLNNNQANDIRYEELENIWDAMKVVLREKYLVNVNVENAGSEELAMKMYALINQNADSHEEER